MCKTEVALAGCGACGFGGLVALFSAWCRRGRAAALLPLGGAAFGVALAGSFALVSAACAGAEAAAWEEALALEAFAGLATTCCFFALLWWVPSLLFLWILFAITAGGAAFLASAERAGFCGKR